VTDARSQLTGASLPRGRALVVQLAAPLRRYVGTEAGGGALLLAATVAALVWANSPVSGSYAVFWDTEVSLRAGNAEIALGLRHWVNDGLMVLFFFVVGLEVKRELVMGGLTDRRRAVVPAVAALTGLAVPALIYLTINHGHAAAAAFGVVVSTDTAFVLGVLALVGPGATQLRLFLLTLAIADDIGALAVIALFYTERIALGPLALAVAGLGLMAALRYLRLWRGPAYLVIALGVWVAMERSGIHPTVAAVIVALAAPTYPARRDEVEDAARLTHAYRQSPDPGLARAARLSLVRSVSANERLQQLYHPWTSYVIVPIFALANAGVVLSAEGLRTALTSPITLGVIAGLVLGKPIGIAIGVVAAVRTGCGRLAPGLSVGSLAGGAVLSGMGFTIALLIVDLALTDPVQAEQARVGVLAASLIAAVLGWAVLRLNTLLGRGDGTADRPTELMPPVDPDRDHIRGSTDAPLTLVEYGDFECPFCGQATGVVAELRERFGDRLRYVFRHVPLTDVHPHAQLAAEAAEAAGAQGRFWEMHDRLFAHQDELGAADLLDHAVAVGLDLPRFSQDLSIGRFADRVRDDAASAQASGVAGTPTFFVGGQRHTGSYDADTLAARLLGPAGDGLRDEPAPPSHRAG
jgi:Na+:H+ antiporter, NhaA family